MKNIILMIGAALFSVSALAHPSNYPHYFGEKGRIVYGSQIAPEVSKRTYREGRNMVTITTTRECVRVRSNRNHLRCTQWRTRINKEVTRVQRDRRDWRNDDNGRDWRHDRDDRNRDWNRG